MSDFASILNRQIGSTPPPKPLPIGTYTCVIKEHKIEPKVGQNENALLTYVLTVISAQPDVDQSQLADVTGGVTGKTLRGKFWLTEDAIFRLENFLKDAVGIEGMSTAQGIPMAVGRQVLAHVRHNPAKDGSATVYTEIDSFAKA